MTETTTPGAAPSNPPIPRNPQPIEQVPFYRDVPRSASGMLARVRAWFAAAGATVKAAATPQVQQGTDLVDTAPAAPGRFRVWLSSEWVAVKRERVAVILLAVGVLLLVAAERWWPAAPTAEQAAAVQTNPLAPLVDRLDALDDQVAELKVQVDGLQRLQPQAVAPRRNTAQRTAPAPSTQPSTAPERRRWGTTDLDREIDAFTQSLDTPTPLEPTK